MIILKQSVPKYTIPQLVSELLEAVTIVHKFHLQAKSKSYAEHIALGDFYDAIGDFADSIYEEFAGQTSTVEIPDSKIVGLMPITYLEKLVIFVESTRQSNPEYTHLQNKMDEIKSLIYNILYKLKNLQ